MPSLRSTYPPKLRRLIDVKNTYGFAYNIDGIEANSIISTLKDHTTLLKKDADIRDYSISLRYNNEGPIPSLLPHWTSFVDAISSSNPDNQFWKLNQVTLPDEMIKVLQTLLVSRNIHRLEIVRGNSGSTANQMSIFNLLCNIMEKNSTVRCLVINGTSKFGPALYKAIRTHIALEELHLHGLKLSESESIFRSMINASVNMKYISLRHSTIGQKGAEILSEFLKSNQDLEYLFLGNTHMTDGDATLIAEGLKYNTTLRVLNLGGTKINGSKNRNIVTSAGLQALSKVLFNTSSLYWVANSNHTCRVETASSLPEPCRDEALLNVVNRKGTIKDNRRWKLLSVLYATNGRRISEDNEFNSYRNLKVIPEVLAFIAATFDDDELPVDETEGYAGDDESEVSPKNSTRSTETAITIDDDDEGKKPASPYTARSYDPASGSPVRNQSTFRLYTEANRQAIKDNNPGIGFVELTQLLDKQFTELSTEERKIWDDKAAEDKARYSRELAAYNKYQLERVIDNSDEMSVESDGSFDSYDSELDELDDAFEEEEDEAYENFDKSFLDPAFCGERARLTIMFHVVQKWGLPLLDKNPSIESSAKPTMVDAIS